MRVISRGSCGGSAKNDSTVVTFGSRPFCTVTFSTEDGNFRPTSVGLLTDVPVDGSDPT